MADAEMLEMVKADLEIETDYMDVEAQIKLNKSLLSYIEASKIYIKEEGVTLDLNNPGDAKLLSRYVVYLYRSRKTTDKRPMPRDLRWELNKRAHKEAIRRAG